MSTDSENGQATGDGSTARRRSGGTPTSAEVAESLAARRKAERGERPRSPEAPPEREISDEEAKRGERLVATWFVVAFLAGVAFLVFYVIQPADDSYTAGVSNKLLGGSLTVALFALAIGIVLWVRKLMPNKEMVDERHELRSSEEDRKKFGEYFMDTLESTQVTKRPLLRRTLLLAAVPLGLAPLWLLRDMGPLPKRDLFEQPWRKGMRMVVAGTEESENPRLLKLADVTDYGVALSTLPEGIHEFKETAKAALLIIRLRPGEIREDTKRGRVQEKYAVDGVCAFSKICTHAGCPISLYERETKHLFCPCHQSTFDMVDGANVIFGPAVRALPQLPVNVDSDGYLVADADHFINGPVGPSFWERGSNRNTE
ncbi:MAG: Rieske 2Fe-2S domain-containing protein [Streptosporangiales bacterium]|nr:Rieske 2Fe-2S domain-containing protein [Streptosporangiales bacterium]